MRNVVLVFDFSVACMSSINAEANSSTVTVAHVLTDSTVC